MRQEALRRLERPVILETHGGWGRVYERLYAPLTCPGAVIEKDPRRSVFLARQRPHWLVYEADSETALRLGAGAALPVNLLDVDPYGEAFPVVEAFFCCERPWPERLAVAVHDGLRQKVKLGGAWKTVCLRPWVRKYGNDLYGCYLELAREVVSSLAAKRGYALEFWTGHYAGKNADLSHYLAVLTR